MAKLRSLLVELVLELLILACAEGDTSRPGVGDLRFFRCQDGGLQFQGYYELKFPDPFTYIMYRLKDIHEPWFEGPNVCKNETTETSNSTAADSRYYIKHYILRFHTCDETETMFKSLIVDMDTTETRKYTLIYDCCHGYIRGHKDYGCPNKITELNLIERTEELGLTDFLNAVKMLQLTNKLQTGNFTLFVPQNGAFSLDSDLIDAGAGLILKSAFLLKDPYPSHVPALSRSAVIFRSEVQWNFSNQDAPAVIEVSDPAVDKALQSLQSAILSHMVPGIRTLKSKGFTELLQTAGPDGTVIRINHFYRHGPVVMANCVPIITSDVATNGVIHRVEKVLKPVKESLLDIIRSRPELSTLKTILANAKYESKLDHMKYRYLTILAPTNSAFDKISSFYRDKLLEGDLKYLKKFQQNHLMLDGEMICVKAIEGYREIIRLDWYMKITRTNDNKTFFNDAQAVESDVMGTNGVMHIIDKALVPKAALGLAQILEEEGLTELLKLIKKADLLKDLEAMQRITIFAPSNEAIESLNAEVKNKLTDSPDFLKSVLLFHVSPNLKDRRRLHGSVMLTTLANQEIRINTFRSWDDKKKTVQCVPYTGVDQIKYFSGKINVIDSVMIPPEGNIMDVLGRNTNFSKFVSLIKKTSFADFLQEDGLLTVFAPTNEAFDLVGEGTLNKYDENPKALEKFIKHHIYKGNLCCSRILEDFRMVIRGVMTMAKDNLKHSSSPGGIPKLGHAFVTTCDQTATNGNVLGLDQVLLK